MSRPQTLTSLQDLGKLVIQIQRAGSHYKARYFGQSNFVFGATAPEARQRLMDSPSTCFRDSRRNGEIREHNFSFGFRSVKGRR